MILLKILNNFFFGFLVGFVLSHYIIDVYFKPQPIYHSVDTLSIVTEARRGWVRKSDVEKIKSKQKRHIVEIIDVVSAEDSLIISDGSYIPMFYSDTTFSFFAHDLKHDFSFDIGLKTGFYPTENIFSFDTYLMKYKIKDKTHWYNNPYISIPTGIIIGGGIGFGIGYIKGRMR